MQVLVVCTANVCRSPMGEVIVAERLAAHGIDARVDSGGVQASIGEGACEDMWVNSGFEFPAGRTGQQVTPADLDAADFVLTFETSHRERLVNMHPDARDHIFTLVEVASLAQAVNLSRDRPVDFDDRVRWFAEQMDALRSTSPLVLIEDPQLSDDGESIIDPLFRTENVHPHVRLLTRTCADQFAIALARYLQTKAIPISSARTEL